MDKTFRRIVSFVMAMAIVLSIGGLNVLAITEEDEVTLHFGASNVTVTKSNEAQPVSISFYISEDAEIASFGVQNISISDPNQMGVTFAGNAVVANTSFSGMNNIVDGSTTGGITMSDITAGHHMTYNSELNGYVLFTLPLTIPANATGTATVTFSQISAADNEIGDGYSVNSTPVTATIEVKEPEEEADPDNPKFTVYYQIDGTDSDNDNFYEVDPGAIVDVGVYVKADSAQTMQAFDIYPKWDAPLTYSDVVGETGVTVVKTEMSKANPHFTTNLTDATAAATNKQITTAGVKIATLKLTLDEPAVHSQQYKIYFSDAFATNLAREKDAESVNVTYDTEGVMGVETLKIYKVSYDDGVSEPDAPVSVPNSQEKQHGVQLTLSATEPKREGYTFAGWLGSDNVTYEPGDEYNTNADLVLTAQWTRDQVTVTFDMNDHGTQVSQQTIDPGAKATKPTDPTETGWKFIGWYSNKALTNAFDFDAPINANTTIYAKWEIEKYDVTFNMNGHGDAIEEQTIEYNKTASKPTAPTATGYTFEGWYTEAACENEFNFDTSITKATELFAKWTPVEVTVTLNVNGGDALDQNSITVTYGEKYTNLPTNPNKTGYTFDGWYDEKNNEVTKDTEVTNAAEHELTAKWTANTYTVKFNPGTYGKGDMDAQTLTYDKSENLKLNMFESTDSSYAFAGWATSENSDTVVYKDGESVTNLAASGEVNLYAVWKQNTISYKADPAGVQMTLTDLPVSYELGKALEITAKPTAEGYTFNGWSNEALGINTKGKPNEPITIPADTTGSIELTAHWTINQYTITFDSGDGTAVDSITEDYGTEIEAPDAPTRTGYTFKGWFEDNTEFTFPHTLKTDKTLYAKWEINKFTVTFNANGHGTAPADQTVEYNKTASVPTEPTELGYTFVGWYTEEACKNAFDFYTSITADTTLYAKWTENTYTIKFDGDASTEAPKENVRYTEEVTLPEITKPGYELVGWTDEETGTTAKYEEGAVSKLVSENGGEVTLYPIWTEATYKLSFDLGAHPANDANVPDEIKVTYNGTYSGLTDVTAATGYKFTGWSIDEKTIQNGATVEITKDSTAIAQYEAIDYTIVYDANDGDVDTTSASKTYTIETTALILPTPTWENHNFVKWVVKEDSGSWKAGSEFSPTLNKAWGNVKVYAQWESSVITVVESYKYAMDGYVMLRIPTDTKDNAYTFNGMKMFYTDDGEYKIDGKAVFVTLIPENNGKEGDALVSYVAKGKLTDAGLALLKQGSKEATVIDRTSGRINMNDEIVNIADANAVYQMVVNGGSYYSEAQLSIEKRLMADMFTEYTAGDARGTLQDVNEIVKLINAAANATTNP